MKVAESLLSDGYLEPTFGFCFFNFLVNYTAKATCDAFSGDSTSGTPSKRLTTGG